MDPNRRNTLWTPMRKALATMVAGLIICGLCTFTAYAAENGGGTSGTGGSAPSAPSGSGAGSASQTGSTGGGTQPGGSAGGGSAAGGGGGASTASFDFKGSYIATLIADGTEKSSSKEAYDASTADQNTALVENGGTLTMEGDTLTKSGDDSNGDNCNFYGLNSILLGVGENSKAYVTDTSLTSDSEGSNGIFSTDKATVYARGDSITTSKGNSRGLDATYDGTIVADSLKIQTAGAHCASIATDRGGGYISVTDSQLATAGSGSPLLYSTGDIEVDKVSGTATGSQIAGMEGLNTILIKDSTLTSTVTGKTASDPVADAVIIYQSTSGDAEKTTGAAATFDAVDSTLKSSIASGAFFYLTNTKANIVLQNTKLDFDSNAADLILASANDSNNWGKSGSNGATVNFTARGETLSGKAECDSISTLKMYLLDNTTWTGSSALLANSAATADQSATLDVNVGSDSTWVVSADSTVTDLNVASGGKVIDSAGNNVTIVAGGQTAVQGTAGVTVTVVGSYSTDVSTGDVNNVSDTGVDRSGFDNHYSTSTSFAMGSGGSVASSSSTKSTSSGNSGTSSNSSASWWENLVSGFRSLFGLR